MFKQQRLTVLSTAVLLALLFAAVVPMSVLADDGVPPTDAPITEEVVPPVVDVPATEVPVVDVPVAEEVVPAVEEPQTVSEVLAEVPAGTDVVVLDQAGEALPLASAEAAEAILVSDPVYCISGKTPADGATGGNANCTDGYTSVEALVTAGVGGLAAGGTIFFTTGAYSASTNEGTAGLLNLNAGSVFGSAALTLQGGWNGTLGGSSALLGTQTIFSLPVSMTGWTGTVTLNNISVSGVTTTQDNALTIKSTGDVVLNNVTVSNNSVDSDASNSGSAGGAYIETTKNVTVSNSTFNSNQNTGAGHTGQSYGLGIRADKDVTLNNVIANYNKGDGVDIDKNATGLTSVTVSDSTFNFNTSTAKTGAGDLWGNGLWINNVKGDITLNNVTAMYNTYNGVEVGVVSKEGTSGNGTTGNIYVNGGTFAYNGKDGLHLNADKNITLNGVTTYGNRDDGAELCAGKDVNLNGGDFYQNQYGLYIRCGQNVNSSYGNWWDNYYWGYYWGPGWGGNYYGYYSNYWGYGWALPIWGNVTINNIYVNSYFMPNFGSYYGFYNSYYYGHGWNPYGWNDNPSGYWYKRWLKRMKSPIVTTKPMTVTTTPLTEAELPEALPDDKTFADAFKLKASVGVPGEVTKASFDAPADLAADATVTVLSWDGTEWTEVPSEIVDGKVEFKVGASGTFALATP